MTAPTLYTIGHSNHSADAFLALLALHAVRVLVDVRSVPHSQYNPQFNQGAIKASAEAAGLEYRYAGEFLGGRPKDPGLFKAEDETPNADSWAYADVKYDALMRSEPYRRGIKRLLELAAGARVAVMCSEGDPLECHRHHLIARSLIDPLVKVTDAAVNVVHIRRDGSTAAVGADDFRTQLPLF